MYNLSRDNVKESAKVIFKISATLVFFIGSLSITNITSNANAFDLISLGVSDNLGQSVKCVIVVIGCDGTGSVGSSGDTIIGSNNSNNNNNNSSSGSTPGTLLVSKEVECESDNQAICDFAVTSTLFPSSADYPITVSGNNPDPTNFPGSSTGTEVSVGVGNFAITEELASTQDLQNQLQATSIITTTTAQGDCTPNFNVNQVFQDATGTMTSAGSQECTLINKIIITGGSVPST